MMYMKDVSTKDSKKNVQCSFIQQHVKLSQHFHKGVYSILIFFFQITDKNIKPCYENLHIISFRDPHFRKIFRNVTN